MLTFCVGTLHVATTCDYLRFQCEKTCSCTVDSGLYCVESSAVVVLVELAPLDETIRTRVVDEFLTRDEVIMHTVLFTSTTRTCCVWKEVWLVNYNVGRYLQF